MPQTAPQDTAPATTAQRLRRLQALVLERTDGELGRSYIETYLQDADSPDARCPRFAGIISESGDEYVIAAETIEDLRAEMGQHAGADVPKLPVEMVDLDTEETRDAELHSQVTFCDENAPPPATREQQFVLVTVTHSGIEDHTLARDQDDALRHLHALITEWWQYEVGRGANLPEQMPDDPQEAVELYFSRIPGERYSNETLALANPDPPAPPAVLASAGAS